MACHQLNSPQKNRIVGAIRAGASIRHAACLENVPRTTAQSIWKKWLAQGSTSNWSWKGRPKRLDALLHEFLVHHAINYRFMPLSTLGKKLGVSRHLVRRELAREGLHRRRVRRVLKRTPIQEAARLIWAMSHKDWGLAEWSNALFSDESYICVDGNIGNVWVTQRPHEEFERCCTIERPSQSPLRIMVWACIAYNLKGPLIILSYPGGRGGGMTAARYKEQVLEPVLIPIFHQLHSVRPNLVFQQDNACFHVAKASIQLLDRNSVPRFPHPPISPDVSAIEPVWFGWKNNFRARPSLPEKIKWAYPGCHWILGCTYYRAN